MVAGRRVWVALEGWVWGAAGSCRGAVYRVGWGFWEGTGLVLLCSGKKAGKEVEEEGGWGPGGGSGCCDGVRREVEGCSGQRAGLVWNS